MTRLRTTLEGSRGFTLGERLSLTPSVEVGLRQDGGDAENGTGMDIGGGLAFTDSVTGLSLDVQVRTLVVHQADGFRERGMSLSFGWDPTPSSPMGLNARIAPSWGGQATGGAEALWNSQMSCGGMGSHQMYGAGRQVNAEIGYGLPVGARFVGTPRVGYSASQYGGDYSLGLLNSEELRLRARGRRAAAREPPDGGRQQRRARPGHDRVVARHARRLRPRARRLQGNATPDKAPRPSPRTMGERPCSPANRRSSSQERVRTRPTAVP